MNPDLPIDLDKVRRFREGLMRKLATGRDPALAEMAREVQAGRITLREAAFGAYREQVTVLAEKAAVAMRQVSKEDLERAMEENTLDDAIEQLGAMPEPEPEEEALAPLARRPEPEEGDESILLAPPSTDRPADRPQRERWKRRWS